MDGAADGQAVAVARAVAGDDAPQFGPVDVAVDPVAGRRVVVQRRVGEGQAEVVRLWHRRIDEFLPQPVIGEPLDAPAHRGVGVRAVAVRRAEHHQHRPPPAIERVLRHRLLLLRAVAERAS